MCEYRETCPLVDFDKDNKICFSTARDCKIYPMIEELNELRNDIKDCTIQAAEYRSAIKKFQKMIYDYKEILEYLVENHEKIKKLEREIDDSNVLKISCE